MSKTRLLTLICACFLFLSFKNAFAFSLIHDLPYQRSNGITYTDVIATRDNLHTYYAYYDIPVNGSIPDITRYGFDWGISFGCNGPACTDPGYHLYMITCDQNNNNCVDGYDTGTATQVVGSSVGQPTCWDNDHVAVSRGFVWYYDYPGLCGVGDVTAGSLFPPNYNTTPGLVAYWSFDNYDATDDSGNGHNGTIYGNPQCVDGENGNGYSFDGQDDYIETEPLGISTGDSFTVSFWMNFEWQEHRIWTLYFGNPNNCWNNGFHSLINVNTEWGLDRGIVQYGPHCGTQNQFNIANLQGQWVHVVTVYKQRWPGLFGQSKAVFK